MVLLGITACSTSKKIDHLPKNELSSEHTYWWSQFNDPILLQLIENAQAVSGSVANAAANIIAARTNLTTIKGSTQPTVNATAELNRSSFTFGGPLAYRSQSALGFISSWEINLFGALAKAQEAAQANLNASEKQWQAVRNGVSAETATHYVQLRLCQKQEYQKQLLTETLKRSSQAVAASTAQGLNSSIELSQIQQRYQQALIAWSQQQTNCEKIFKTLLAITGQPAHELHQQLAEKKAQLPQAPKKTIPALAAHIVEQRPDIAALQSQTLAAAAEIGIAKSQSYPSVSLLGQVLPSRISFNGGQTMSLTTWSFGPSIGLPILDGGGRQARVEAAQANYLAKQAQLEDGVRHAIAEVERALLEVNTSLSTLHIHANALAAANTELELTNARFKQGFTSGIQLENTKHNQIQAQEMYEIYLANHTLAWIGLYRAVGGVWLPELNHNKELHVHEQEKR